MIAKFFTYTTWIGRMLFTETEDWNKVVGEKNKEISFRHIELEVPERLPSVITK